MDTNKLPAEVISWEGAGSGWGEVKSTFTVSELLECFAKKTDPFITYIK